jgi:O-acetyl-ADP-ribose deacetylase (regulator of RNase III)
MVNYTIGNLFETKANVIAHGVNCKGAFGAGIAGQIRKLYPIVADSYLGKYNKQGWNLGDVQFVTVQANFFIANCATQYDFGSEGIYVNYNALHKCLSKVLKFCKDGQYSLALPRIGAGLAGGNWKIIKGILEEAAEGHPYDITVYSLEQDSGKS